VADGCAVRINLPATFQFSPATSKSTDIPDCYFFSYAWHGDKWCKILHSRSPGTNFIIETSFFFVLFFSYFQQLFKTLFYYFWLHSGSDSGTSICWLQRCVKILFLKCNLTWKTEPRPPAVKGTELARRGERLCHPHQFTCHFSIFSCYFKIYWHPWWHVAHIFSNCSR
jgi:hypothetical protein